jgi:NADH-quinone oxidoreductase subunit E
MNRINELIKPLPPIKEKSALLPVLHEVQDAHDNWLSTELMDKVAEIIQVLPIEVYEWYLYTMYNQNQSVSICLNFVKHHFALNGTEDLMDYTCEKLGVQLEEITADGLLK